VDSEARKEELFIIKPAQSQRRPDKKDSCGYQNFLRSFSQPGTAPAKSSIKDYLESRPDL
jgi:hypothetical protein